MSTTADAPPAWNAAPGDPAPASTRAYLRSGLPAVYREHAPDQPEPFSMRFVEGLEQVLDPIVAILDQLPAHLDLDLAPPEVVALVGGWLGMDLPDVLSEPLRRRIVRRATSVNRARGTRAGLQELLGVAFADLDIEVHDSGGATWSAEPSPWVAAAFPRVTVVCRGEVGARERVAIRRLVEEVTPAHVAFELRCEEDAAP